MVRKNHIINVADPESTLGWAISDSISLAKKVNQPVIAYVRGVACVITKDTSVEAGIARYRKTAERFARVRS